MKIGLVGLPKSGKTTLFNLLTGSSVATSRYDAGRAELHTGIARVPDPRVDRLTALFTPKKTTYATLSRSLQHHGGGVAMKARKTALGPGLRGVLRSPGRPGVAPRGSASVLGGDCAGSGK